MAMNQIIAGLPAILGATVLVVFQILKRHGKGDRITSEILAKLRHEDAGTAEKYKDADPKALAKAIEHDRALRQLKESNDYQLLRQALQQQFIISILVYAFSSIAIVVGTWLFIIHDRDVKGAGLKQQQIELDAKKTESESALATQMEQMRIQITAINKSISERSKPLGSAEQPPPLDPQDLQRAKELESKLAESNREVAAYKSLYGELPKALDPTVLQDATNTIATVRAMGDQLGFMTARVAEENLSSAARKKISLLLDGHRISDPEIVNWANDLRGPPSQNVEVNEIRQKYPQFIRWRFVNIPVGSKSYDANLVCPQGQCLIAKASEFIDVLRNKSTPQTERATVVKWLVALICDLHRPLHCADRDNDLGGNKVRIAPGRKSLHLLWDRDFPRALAAENAAETFAVRLNTEVTEQKRNQWNAGTPEDWAWESFKVAEQKVYGPLPSPLRRIEKPSGTELEVRLPDGYEDEAKKVVQEQIQKGGVRLAWIFNTAFKAD